MKVLHIKWHLKTCQCGGKAEMCYTHISYSNECVDILFWVHCTNCKRTTERYENKIAAINDWNHNRTYIPTWLMVERLMKNKGE